MLLSEILASEPVPERIYGVTVDQFQEKIPADLREIGLLIAPDGVVDTDTFDVAIFYLMTEKIDVIIEVPADRPIKDSADLMAMSGSVGYHISLLPPQNDDDVEFEAYAQRLEQFAALFCESPNFTKLLMPVTSYFEYLVVEAIDPEAAAGFAPKDPYVLERFASVIGEARSDAFKARMRAVFEKSFGGAERFLAFRKSLVAEVYGGIRPMAQQIADQEAARKAAFLASGGTA